MQNETVDLRPLDNIWILGNKENMRQMMNAPALEPFSEQIVSFLSEVSKILLATKGVREYPDVVTLAFWMRKSSVESLRKQFDGEDGRIRLGRGLVFHVSPSNVPVNFAYSMVSGLLCGNANVVRLPSKDFPQVEIISSALSEALEKHPEMRSYLALVRYGHDSAVNDLLSGMADVRVIWGGNATIQIFRKSPMKPRATEITFADRYSLAVIDSDAYMDIADKHKVAVDFYNDTYLTDQNACTSPRLIAWMGSRIEEAKDTFWSILHDYAIQNYELHDVQVISKLTKACLLAANYDDVEKISADDNLIVRMRVNKVTADLMELKGNSGYFFEYDCQDILEMKDICNDTRCQTISYIGNKDVILPLICGGVRGIDRVVPMGKTMDFDLIWDGYNLFERMTRTVDMI